MEKKQYFCFRGAVYTGVQTYQFELRISRIYWRGKVGNHKRFNRRRYYEEIR